MLSTPRTPTPFKNALAAQEKMHGPLKIEVSAQTWLCPFPLQVVSMWLVDVVRLCDPQPQPLAFLEEDIREVLKQETGADIFNRADVQPDYRAWKHNVCVACKHFTHKYLQMRAFKRTCLHGSTVDGTMSFTVFFCLGPLIFRSMVQLERCANLWCWTPGGKTA